MKKHFKQMARKTLTASIAALLLATTLPFGSIAEDVTEKRHFMKGDIPVDEEILLQNAATDSGLTGDGVLSLDSDDLPNKVDLSTSRFFPPIFDQGDVSSCTACATVYYQFTYEANKLNEITSTSDNAYSPAWPFYYIQDGNTATDGSNYADAYNFLIEHGALRMTDNPYSTTYDPSKPFPSNFEKIREALNTRVENYVPMSIDATGTPITSVNDSDLKAVKTYLASGKVLRVSSRFVFNEVQVGNDTIFYRCKYDKDSHCVVIVGYDDTKCYDVNGNGIIEESEKGAFKIANSWGTDYGNNGYVWILYDALNQVSNIPGNWESSLSGDRIAAFKQGETDIYMWFTAIVVKKYEVDYVAEIQISNINGEERELYLVREKGNRKAERRMLLPNKSAGNSFTLIFDYFDICKNVETYNNDFYLGVNLTAPSRYILDGSVTDNRGNRIEAMYYVPGNTTGRYLAPIDLIRGDINYSGTITNADVILVTRYCSGWNNLSNIQIYLADYNGDGTVTNADVILMQRYITNNS